MQRIKSLTKKSINEFVEAAKQVARYGLVACGSGNLSSRIDNKHMLITTSGSWMEEMSDNQVSVCKISDGKSQDGKNPSIEINFHAGILRNRQDGTPP